MIDFTGHVNIFFVPWQTIGLQGSRQTHGFVGLRSTSQKLFLMNAFNLYLMKKKRLAAKVGCPLTGLSFSERVDKHGRSLSQTQEKDNLSRFYRAEEDVALPDYARGAVLLESSDEEDESENDDSDDGKYVAVGNRPDEKTEINLDEDSIAELDAQAAAYQKTLAEQTDTVADRTRRLAFVNLDWDHVRGAHILKICSSVVSTKAATGRVLNVRVYPSQFGKEQLAREEKEGPPKEIFQKQGDDNDVNERNIFEVGGEDDYNNEALRQYQLQRMRYLSCFITHSKHSYMLQRYYYAIVECDTVSTVIYDELEGTELTKDCSSKSDQTMKNTCVEGALP